jgi:geranyl-CoA carboxylase alpha subunit
LIEALKATVLFGTRHNRDFLVACLEKPCFADGRATTAFIAQEFGAGEIAEYQPRFADSAIAAVLEETMQYQQLQGHTVIVAPQLRDWASASPLLSRKQYQHGEAIHDLCITPLGNRHYRVFDAQQVVEIGMLSLDADCADISIDGARHTVRFLYSEPGSLHLSVDGHAAQYRDLIRLDGALDLTGGSGKILAPMHGLLLEVRVALNDHVEHGQTLAILEAMKMHYEIAADASGTVTAIVATAGTQVAADDLLIEIDIEE